MKETIEILADPATARRILESVDQAGKGKTISEKEFSRKFGL
jgi:PHD/YefM family antitoxin component YafN of YafNO toxin-antitoxin module